jgi:NAD(P)-dependent dehydrogenase (short-subunit alcohol dehydrogenase family)
MSGGERGRVLITGSSTGIGRACALLLDRRGYRVFAGVRRMPDAESLRKEASERLVPVMLDITDARQIADARALVEAAVGPDAGLTGLLNCAGIMVAGALEYLPLDRLRWQLEVNLIGQVAVTQALLPLIRQGRGRIINVGSGNGRFAFPFMGAYAASKFGLEAVTDAFRRELRPWRIPVSIIDPGTVETAIWDSGKAALDALHAQVAPTARRLYDAEFSAMMELMLDKGRGSASPPEALAELALEVLESKRPRARYRRGPGSTMAVIGSYLPERFTDWIVAKVIRKELPSRVFGW